LRAEREDHARAMGRVVAARVAEAQASRAPGELSSLVEAQVGGRTGLTALGVYDESGQRVAAAGKPDDLEALPLRAEAIERVEQHTMVHGPAVRVTIPGPRGTVVALLRTDDEGTRTGPLLRLVALYVGAFGLALLIFVYIALGRLVVLPLDRLALAARRVTEGPRSERLDGGQPFPRLGFGDVGGPREMRELGQSLSAMTARLEAEEDKLLSKVHELERTTDELRAAQQSLVRSERLASVGRLSAGLAHEIGNPLAAIAAMTDLLREGDLPAEEASDFLQRMQRETTRITGIVRDLLDFARPDAQRAVDEPGDVGVAVRDAAKLVQPQRAFRDVRLELALAASTPPVALSQEHLAQVLLNLLLNAAHATPHGHVRLTTSFEASARVVRLVVEDDGPGIDARVAATLFEPFVTTKEVGEGTGLGLAVCRGLIEGVGGTIDTGPRADGLPGARFDVVLPTVPRAAGNAPEAG
jgi:signal transduction histidine kinase